MDEIKSYKQEIERIRKEGIKTARYAKGAFIAAVFAMLAVALVLLLFIEYYK